MKKGTCQPVHGEQDVDGRCLLVENYTHVAVMSDRSLLQRLSPVPSEHETRGSHSRNPAGSSHVQQSPAGLTKETNQGNHQRKDQGVSIRSGTLRLCWSEWPIGSPGASWPHTRPRDEMAPTPPFFNVSPLSPLKSRQRRRSGSQGGRFSPKDGLDMFRL